MRQLNMHPGGPSFFLCWVKGQEGCEFDSFGFWCSHRFPMMFPTCSSSSKHAPPTCSSSSNVFFKMFSIVPYFIPYAQSWTDISYRGEPKGSTSTLLFVEFAQCKHSHNDSLLGWLSNGLSLYIWRQENYQEHLQKTGESNKLTIRLYFRWSIGIK